MEGRINRKRNERVKSARRSSPGEMTATFDLVFLGMSENLKLLSIP